MAVPIISREQWGAAPWRNQAPYDVSDRERTEFFVHYHGAPPPARVGSAVPRNVEKIHLANGWSGVGYNFVVDLDGTVYEGRGWGKVGAHSPRHNRQGWAAYVALGGDQEPTEEALSSVRALYDEGCVRSGRTLAKLGHRDARSTACPGDNLYAWVRGGMAVSGLIAAAPVAIGDGSSLDRPVLARGTRGRHVTALQEALVVLGYPVDIDGIFGLGLETAVRVFQREHSLVADGIVGPATYAALSRIINEEEGFMKTLIVQYPGRSTQYIVVPGVSKKHIATTADVRAYELAGAQRAVLTADELDGYPTVTA